MTAVSRAAVGAMEGSTIAAMYMEALAKKYNFSLDEPLENLPKETIDKILYGTGDDELTINKNRFTAEVLISINLRV